MTEIERFTCQKCGKRWWALNVPEMLLPCTCDPAAFMKKYLEVLEAHDERTMVYFYGPAVDRLQEMPTLIDNLGRLYKVNARIFASQVVYDKLYAEIAALKEAARNVVADTSEDNIVKLRDLVHPPAVGEPRS